MAYTATTFSFGEQPSAAKWNQLGSNDASFHDGTGIANLTIGSITAVKNDYKFSVYRNSALASASNALIIFDTKLFDTGTNYSTSTGLFTAPVAGFYKFDAVVQYSSNAAFVWALALQKNGSGNLVNSDYRLGTTGTNQAMIGVFPPIQLAANDTIGVMFNSSNGGNTTITVGTAPTQTWFSGFLVSAT